MPENSSMISNKKQNGYYLVFFVVYGIAITLFSQNIPFFWDSILISWTGHFFLENGFSGFIVPEELDFGHIPFYGYYISLMWKLFGRSLLVSHIAMLPFIIAFHYATYKLAKKYVSGIVLFFTVLLIIANPIIMTQEVLMAYDIVLACFFLWALIALLENKRLLYTLFLILTMLVSVRGIYLVAALFIFDVFLNIKKIGLRLFIPYAVFALVFTSWFVYHKIKTGWFFFSPELQQTDRKFVDITMFFRQLFYIFWKIIDLGNIAIVITLIVGAYYSWKKKLLESETKKLIVLLIIVVAVMGLGMAVLSNPVGHKYFIVVYAIMTIITTNFFHIIKKHAIRWMVFLLILFILISGNIWIYPVKYGNGWDSSLKVLPYFSLEKQMRIYILEQKINPKEVAAHFPMYAGTKYSLLDDNDISYQILDDMEINKYKFILYSNVSNKFTPQTIQTLNTKWILLHQLKQGFVHIKLYQNPNYIVKE